MPDHRYIKIHSCVDCPHGRSVQDGAQGKWGLQCSKLHEPIENAGEILPGCPLPKPPTPDASRYNPPDKEAIRHRIAAKHITLKIAAERIGVKYMTLQAYGTERNVCPYSVWYALGAL